MSDLEISTGNVKFEKAVVKEYQRSPLALVSVQASVEMTNGESTYFVPNVPVYEITDLSVSEAHSLAGKINRASNPLAYAKAVYKNREG